jgi:microcystin synthetase protein McyG
MDTANTIPSSQRLLRALNEACAKLEAVECSKTEPIAIIGTSFRFPGGSHDLESFWRLLRDGQDAMTEIPANRWDIAAYYDPEPAAKGKIYSRYAGFLQDIEQFDASFFGLSPREAISLDPQQRLLLEISWEALENAGQEKWVGSQTGVFIGVTTHDYATRIIQSGGLSQIDTYFGMGNALNAIAGRLSYVLGIQGPSMAIDTACSSSLVAIHLACQSLRSGECNMVLAGGTNLILSPESSIVPSRTQMLAPDGHCKTFDAAADGYGRGEGCAVVVMKRLSDAQKDNDNILALIRGSAVNQDGASGGFTVPNGVAQQAVMRQALAQAKVAPHEIDYLEAHGTGTALGDPIEVGAANAVLGEGRAHPLIIGTVKTNIGHLEAAAGIAGLIKVVLALQHEQIPPHLHLKQPNPQIPWDDIPVRIPIEGMPWRRGEKKRLAGVSSFGASGTNAHVVVEEAPVVTSVEPQNGERPLHLLTLSAKTELALKQLAQKYIRFIRESRSVNGGLATLGDVCFSANTTRTHFKHRLCIVADSFTQMQEKLQTFGQTTDGVFQGLVKGIRQPKIAFLFTGQGSQYVNMGRELYETQAIFRDTLNLCDQILQPKLGQSILDILYPESLHHSLLNETAYTQPALFALEYALAQLWQSWGIKPTMVMGHSVGEYVAACVAGVFSLEEGLKLIAERGRLMQTLPQNGQMVALSVNEAQIAPFIPAVSIAAFNGPENIVISGHHQAIDNMIERLPGIKMKKLAVSHAFHSSLMEPILAEFERVASEISYSAPQIALCSNITGEFIQAEIANPQYWVNHIRQPVQFAKSMERLAQSGCEIFLEIGPQPTLLGMGRQCLPAEVGVWLPSLRQGQNDWPAMLQSLAELYIHGIHVDWLNFDRDYPRRRVILPNYAWQHQRYWIEPAKNTALIQNLQEGKTQQLIEQLSKTGAFTPDEQNLLPKVIKVLTDQYQQQIASIQDWFYQVEWRTQLSQGLSPDYLLSPHRLQNQLQADLEELKTRADLSEHWQIFNQIEALSIGYVINAFHQLGWTFTLGDRFTTIEISRQLDIISQYQRLLGRLLEMLAEEGILRGGTSWEVIKLPLAQNFQAPLQTLITQHPEFQAELTMLKRCGEKLAEVLQGKCDPLHELLFPEGDLTTAAELYQDTLGSQVMNTLVQKTMTTALAHLPPNRKLRILEIGAGTGGTTSYILPHLSPQQTDYVLTDLSTLFLRTAKEKFRDYPFIQYQLLDIEQPPETQKLHQYDLILVANVLHATQDLRQSVQHVQQLLKPGGMLVLLENTERLRFVDLIFGLTEGWWRFTDSDLRPAHPLISTAQWQTLLEDNGFQQTATLSASQEEGGLLSKQAVIIAQTANSQIALANPIEPTVAHWLIFADRQGIAQALQTRLQARGDDCTLVYPGETYQQLTDSTYQLNPNHPNDFQQLLSRITRENLHNVIHLWSLDAPKANALTAINLETISQTICSSVLYNLQALLKAVLPKQPQLWLVTQGVAALKNAKIEGLAQSPLWGLGKVITLEHPEFKTVRIDLDPKIKRDEAAQMLFEEISSNDDMLEDQIAYYDNARQVARLVRKSQTALPLTFRDEVTYLITGGLGGLGLLVVEWMVKKGAKHLTLVGRKTPSSTVQEKLSQLKSTDVQIRVLQADISIAEQVAKVLSEIEQNMPPLGGIIHAVGVLDDGVLQQQSWARFAKVMAPKVSGAWHLHHLTQHHPLDFFVLFSSAVSLLGHAGQANHAAANAFLDALAHYRQAQGLAGLSINWGAWAEVGAAAEHNIDERFKMKGVNTLSPQQGLLALEQALSQPKAQIGVIPIDSSQSPWLTSPFFSELLSEKNVIKQQTVNFIEKFNQSPIRKRRAVLIGHVRTQVAKVLALDSPDSIDLQQGFFELGMDSLTSVELRNHLQKSLEWTLPATLAFDYPTTEELVDYLLKAVPTLVMETSIEPSTTASAVKPLKNERASKNLDGLSEDELGALIDETLVNIEEA